MGDLQMQPAAGDRLVKYIGDRLRFTLSGAADAFAKALPELGGGKPAIKVAGADYELEDGAVVIAAITSCTRSRQPSLRRASETWDFTVGSAIQSSAISESQRQPL